MMERRPHWDDDLIKAVGDAIERADSAFYPTVGMVSDVIAVVEDWHEKFVMHGAFRVLAERAANADRLALTTTRDALHTAFAIIANAQNCLGDGDPILGPQWHEAAQRFIQDYNANLDVYTGYRVLHADALDGGAE